MTVQDDTIFGCDYNSNGGVTAKGDIETIEGLDNAKQSIHNWLLTDKGYYSSIDTEYGSEIRNILGEDDREDTVDALKVYIRNALLANPRVALIERVDVYKRVDNSLVLIISVKLVNGTEQEYNIELED